MEIADAMRDVEKEGEGQTDKCWHSTIVGMRTGQTRNLAGIKQLEIKKRVKRSGDAGGTWWEDPRPHKRGGPVLMKETDCAPLLLWGPEA